MFSDRFLMNVNKWVAMLNGWQYQFTTATWYYFSSVAKLLPVINVMLNPIIYM